MGKKIPKRFGNVAMEKGFITAYEFVEAMNIQKTEEARLGRHRLIGEILRSEGYLSPAEIDEVMGAMAGKEGVGSIWGRILGRR